MSNNSKRSKYQCKKCADNGLRIVDRRYRLVDHMLKYHIPLDQVPYSCTLCMFRCMEQQTLLNHVTKYQRHVRVAKEMNVTNHFKYLVVSKNPIVLGDDDMMLLTTFDPMPLQESPFVEDPFDEGGKEFHMLDGSPLQDQTTVHPYIATTLAPAPLVHTHSETPSYIPMQVQHNQPLNANQSAISSTSGLFSTISQTDLPLICNQTVPKQFQNTLMNAISLPTTTCTSTLSAFRKPTMQPIKVTPIATPQIRHDEDTPLQDETFDSLLNIDPNDPLMLEGMRADVDEAEPPRKKVAVQNTVTQCQATPTPAPTPSYQPDLQPVVDVINTAVKSITDAIEQNTRAVRCQETTLAKVVSELAYFNRQFKHMRESNRQPWSPDKETSNSNNNNSKTKSTSKNNEKENKPVLKSVVNKCKNK